jgi:hypothetical protein
MLQGMAGRRERHDGRVRGVRCVVYLVGLCVMLLAVAGAAEAGDWQRMPSRSPEPYDHVVSDARGNTVAVWSGQDLSGQNTFVRAAFRLAGGSWGTRRSPAGHLDVWDLLVGGARRDVAGGAGGRHVGA